MKIHETGKSYIRTHVIYIIIADLFFYHCWMYDRFKIKMSKSVLIYAM